MELTQLGTLSEFNAALGAIAGGDRLLRRLFSKTYTEFVSNLWADIDDILLRMERNRARFEKSTEDEITFYIASLLEEMGYSASNGTQFSGSVDLTVRKAAKNWLWTAEAKLFTAMDKVNEGFLQLSTRYSPGNFEEASAGMLIYIRTEDAASKIASWRAHLPATHQPVVVVTASDVRPNLCFFSEHKHDDSGLPLRVRHMGVALRHRPKDKSGRMAKKYRSPQSGS